MKPKRTTAIFITVLLAVSLLPMFGGRKGARGGSKAKSSKAKSSKARSTVKRSIKNRADRNNDGKLGPKERERASNIKDRIDKNDDGKIGVRESVHALKNRADKNNDGKIGKHEAHWLRHKINHKVHNTPKKRWVAICKHKAKVNNPIEKKFDANNNGFLDKGEMKALILAKIKHRKKFRLKRTKCETEVERALDANNDGFLEEDELDGVEAELDRQYD